MSSSALRGSVGTIGTTRSASSGRRSGLKLLWHFGYFAITGNSEALYRFRRGVGGEWRKWLSRRSQRAELSWAVMNRLLARDPRPQPRLRARYVVKPWAEEPDAAIPQVRIRGSLGGAIPLGHPTATHFGPTK
jgi:hypothetical protein